MNSAQNLLRARSRESVRSLLGDDYDDERFSPYSLTPSNSQIPLPRTLRCGQEDAGHQRCHRGLTATGMVEVRAQGLALVQARGARLHVFQPCECFALF